jgi:hypothetical protein
MISPKFKFIFVHIQKTGGMSVRSAFSAKWATDHSTALEWKAKKPEEWETYFKFAFVRNPWSFMVSRYFFLSDKKRKGKRGYRTSAGKSFKEWVVWHTSPKRFTQDKKRGFLGVDGFPMQFYRPLSEWISDEKGNIIVDFVGRLENLQGDFDFICKAIDRDRYVLPRINTSKHRDYRSYYDEETRGIVASFFEKDIRNFGYEFG